MTLPLRHGYPDWGRYSVKSTQVFFDDIVNVTTIEGTPTYVTPFVGDIPYIGVRALFNTSDRVQSSFNFFGDAGFTIQTGSFTWVMPQNGLFAWGIPVRGPFVLQRLISQTVPTDLRLTVFETSVGGPAQSLANDVNRLISDTGPEPINGGALQFRASSQIWMGRATLHVSTDAEDFPWHAILTQSNLAGSSRTIAVIEDPCFKAVTIDVIVPPFPLTLEIRNGDSIAHNFRFSLYGDVGWNR